MKIIKPDWNIFKVKFSENPQNNLEWLCYLLFCQEFNKPLGIFRYKNQCAIETNPILVGEEVIGWQAKYFESSLSDHKTDLTDTIQKIIRDYPNLTKLIIYTNQEWGQGKKQNEPQAKIEVEQKAKDYSIEIEWRAKSFFESPFVAIDNNIISNHFFSLDNSIVSLLKEKEMHTESILFGIQTNIEFNSQRIEIDRSDLINNIQDELNEKQILVLNGVGGVGKTAVIKKLYDQIRENVPFYIFKANEFNINNVNELFNKFGLIEFLDAHKDEENKIIVIDSAEKLIDLHNTEPFKEFLSSIISRNWKVMFTTRNNYLDDLNYQFIEIYKITPRNYNIVNLELEELINLSQKNNFFLPEDTKLLDLIKNPFYLSEFLKFYKKDEVIDYIVFKDNLWNKIIKKSKPIREQSFLKVAFERAKLNQFYITIDSNIILDEFVQEEILGYETPGYFITHDIYEEWALEKIIQSGYVKKQNTKDFFDMIGESLPIRRSFRNWVSEKLFLNDDSIKQFVEESINCEDIKPFWKDEVLISVLLSNYSGVFFEQFSKQLLENDYILLKKISFLLRVACKEVDSDLFQKIGLKYNISLSIENFLTKPKGEGWKSLIKFIYDNIDIIGVENIYFILPIIHDWNNKIKYDETTKISSILALKYYQWTINEKIYFIRNENVKEELFQTILHGASLISDELTAIFDEILENKWKKHRDPYCDFIRVILGKLGDNIEVIKTLPTHTLKLAELYWSRTMEDNDNIHDSDSGMGVEKYFALENDHLEYYPASSYQTPIYWLLKYAFEETVDFILDFINKAVESFAKSKFAQYEIEEINVFVGEGKYNKQYCSDRLWNAYRGNQMTPHVFASIHMALEKTFLEISKNTDDIVLESWLLYLLRNSKSASITAIVVSIILANPDKAYRVAMILIKTKEFFLYDQKRVKLERDVKIYNSMENTPDYKRKIHQDERKKSSEDSHRKLCLENLIFNYQFFRNEETSEEEAKNRQHKIWEVFDDYYKELNSKSPDTEDDRVWRLFLARMDRRKMKLATEEKEGEVFISFTPEIDSDLKEYSDAALRDCEERTKFIPLNLWSSYKMQNNDQYKNYEQYENSPTRVLDEVREIVKGLKTAKDADYDLFNHDIPGNACAVLIRDSLNDLSIEDKSFCKDIVLTVASSFMDDNYRYQIHDGVEASIFVLPLLLKEYPVEKANIKKILLLSLFDDTNIGAYCDFSDYPMKAFHNYLWKTSFNEAQTLLFGYLALKPAYEQLEEKIRKKNYSKGIYTVSKKKIVSEFLITNKGSLKKIIDAEVKLSDLGDIEKLDLHILRIAFQLIPNKIENEDHKTIAFKVINRFSKELLSETREERVDYEDKYEFFEKLSYIVLNSSEKDISNYLRSFYDGFNSAEAIADLFKALILAEVRLNTYDKFWYVWDMFYVQIVNLCKGGEEFWYTDKILKTYLLAETHWNEGITEWSTLKEDEKHFFKKVSRSLSHCPSTIFSISKLINGIGSIYLNEGISWISNMIVKSKSEWPSSLNENTSFYIERAVKRYIYLNRERIRKTTKLKQELLVILDFLIEKGSVTCYLLRESIL